MNELVTSSRPEPPQASPLKPASRRPLLVGFAIGLFIILLVSLPPALAIITGLRSGGPGGPLFGPPHALVPLIVLAGLAWLCLAVAPGLAPRDPALEVLRERYARGELTDEDYLRLRETLSRAR